MFQLPEVPDFTVLLRKVAEKLVFQDRPSQNGKREQEYDIDGKKNYDIENELIEL